MHDCSLVLGTAGPRPPAAAGELGRTPGGDNVVGLNRTSSVHQVTQRHPPSWPRERLRQKWRKRYESLSMLHVVARWGAPATPGASPPCLYKKVVGCPRGMEGSLGAALVGMDERRTLQEGAPHLHGL